MQNKGKAKIDEESNKVENEVLNYDFALHSDFALEEIKVATTISPEDGNQKPLEDLKGKESVAGKGEQFADPMPNFSIRLMQESNEDLTNAIVVAEKGVENPPYGPYKRIRVQ